MVQFFVFLMFGFMIGFGVVLGIVSIEAQSAYHRELAAPIRLFRWIWWHHQVKFLFVVAFLVAISFIAGRFSR
jgi:hypothetical protein